MRAIYAAFARRDLDAALEHIAEDVELVVEPTARLAGRTAPYRGHAGVRAYFEDVTREWDELVIEADDYRVLPGSVVVMGHVDGRRGGLQIRRAALWTWRLRDGMASSVRVADLGDAERPDEQ